jgi:hypothetical protein
MGYLQKGKAKRGKSVKIRLQEMVTVEARRLPCIWMEPPQDESHAQECFIRRKEATL